MQRYFHEELEQIRSKLIRMSEKAREVGQLALEGFVECDLKKAERALVMDDEIDALEVEIDRDAVRYITLRGPVSSDVRLILVAIKASHDIERVGDEAHSIAKRTSSILRREGKVFQPVAIAEMGEIAFSMLGDAITAFIEGDLELARSIVHRDSEVNRLNRENYKTLSSELDGDLDNELGEASTQIKIIFISKSIERIADHAKNLAEEVIYLQTGDYHNS